MKKIGWIFVSVILLCSCQGESVSSPVSRPLEADYPVHDLLISTDGYYTDNRLYYTENYLLMYRNLETGADHVLCYDPLCDHTHPDGTTNLASDCHAVLAYAFPKIIAAEENGKQMLYVSEQYKPLSDEIGKEATYATIYKMDVDNMTRRDLIPKNETPIYDFYLYGDTLYLEMATRIEENGKIWYDGSNLHAMPCDGGKMEKVTNLAKGEDCKIIGAEDGYFYWCMDFSMGDVFRSLPDFSTREVVASGVSSLGLTYHDGYVYYMKSSGERATFTPPVIEGEFEEGVSRYGTVSRPLFDYYRTPCGGHTEEVVAGGIQQPMTNVVFDKCTFCIDGAANKAYAVPVALSLDGTIIWEEDLWTMQAFGHSGKPVLTGIFSETGGRLLEIDLETLETREVLSDIGGDILDIYGITDGKIAVQQKVTDTERLRKMQEDGAVMNSALEVTEYVLYDLQK